MDTAGASLLDDPAEWPGFGRAQPDASWESQVVMLGMHCAACALTLEDALNAVPGVVSARVNAASHRARVVWRPSEVRPSQWLAAVRRAGYDALPAADAGRRDLRQREERRMLWRWAVAGFCMMQVMMYAVPAYLAPPGDMTADMAQLLRWASWVLTLPVMVFSSGPFFRSAWRDVSQGRIGMDLPVALGIAIAFIVSSAATFEPAGPLGHEVYFDSLTMFVFFLLSGRWIELRLREKTAGALEALMNRLPDSVDRQVAGRDGEPACEPVYERVAVRRLRVGDVVRVVPGDAFPADGRVLQGDTLADEALLSGESRPVPRGPGSEVLAGSHNVLAAVRVRVERVGAATRFSQVVRLMEQASTSKPRMAQLADRMARPFLWCVLAAAALAAWHAAPDYGRALMLAATVLIVTCPCALSLATPAALLAAAGALARRGVLVRQVQALEALAAVDTVVFDKTGTLTQDGMALAAVRTRPGATAAQALQLAAAIAGGSRHPVSRALVATATAQGRPGQPGQGGPAVHAIVEAAGAGLSARDGAGQALRLGTAAHCGLPPAGASDPGRPAQGPQVHLADGAGWLATFELAEDLRGDAVQAVAALKAAGLRVLILSGDAPQAVARIAQGLGIDDAAGGCSPAGKLERVRALQGAGCRVAMVGDGMNDGPVLAGAHVSFAFGPAVPLAQAHADLVVLGAQLQRVPDAIALARRAVRTVRQNLLWAAGYNALCVPLALAGLLPAWLAGLGMAASSLLVVLNAARLARA